MITLPEVFKQETPFFISPNEGCFPLLPNTTIWKRETSLEEGKRQIGWQLD